MFTCPAGTIPNHPVSLPALEDINPARSLRVDIDTSGNARLREPTMNNSGRVFLDSLSWVAVT
jgi:hypothetical protein